MDSARRLRLSTSEISDVTASMPSLGYSLCNIVLHLLVRYTVLLHRLSQNLAHPVRF